MADYDTTSINTGDVNNNKLIRTDLWSQRVKEELQEELMAQSIVEMIQEDLPDGDTLHIPTLGSLSAEDYSEGDLISLQDPTVGEFLLTIDKYKQSGISVTDKMKDNTFYINTLNSTFPMQCVRALLEQLEDDIFSLHKEQTSNDPNTINGVPHRFVASGTGSVVTIEDISKASLALDKANVSRIGRMAFVSPFVAHTLRLTDLVYRQDFYGPNSVIKQGFGSTSYIGEYMGFSFFQSNMLDDATALDHVAGGALTANMFVGAEAFVGAMRTMPDIEPHRDAKRRRDVYHVVTRYGLALYRPESLVTILTDDSI